MDRNDKTGCWPKSIMESINWLPFLDIMEFTVEITKNDKDLLPSLLKFFTMFKIKCWWNKKKHMI